MKEPILCYVDSSWAYFTTQLLDDQWGDGWRKTPYEYNSSPPSHYDPEYDGQRKSKEPWEIVKVAWEGDFARPCDNLVNSPYSVEMINSGAIAWLRPFSYSDHKVCVHAGTPLPEFIKLVKQAGGKVYMEV